MSTTSTATTSKHTLVSTRVELGLVRKPGLSPYAICEFVQGEVLKGIISAYGREAREYDITPHAGCVGNGYHFTTMEAWSNDTHCTGCDYYNYYGIGD